VDFYEWRNPPTVIDGIVTPDPLSRLRSGNLLGLTCRESRV